MYKVTIGVPVYNAEKFISTALDSFVNQTMKKRDFEVICVDDCSKDETIKIIKKYKRDLNLKIMKLSENSGGPGKPRNTVIDNANGEYIFFVDSDDYIHENTLDNLYNFAQKNNSDMVLAKMKGVNGRGVPAAIFKTTQKEVDLYSNFDLLYALNPLKLFRTSVLRDNEIYFPTNVRAAEDQVFTIKAYLHSKIISVLSDQDYYYATLREGEHMTFSYTAPEEYYQVMCDTVDAIYSISKESMEKKDRLTAAFLNRHFNNSRTTNTTIKRKEPNERKRWLDLLHNFIKNHVPESVDKLTRTDVYPRVTLARANDQENYARYESDVYNKNLDIIIENGKVVAQFDYLTKYPNMGKMDLTDKNKLVHYMNNINMTNDRLTFGCYVEHLLLSDELNSKQKVFAVLVHRERKVEKIIYPLLKCSQSNYYMFDVPYAGVVLGHEDIGVWDLNIVSNVNGHEMRYRLGNQRDPYPYNKNTSYLGYLVADNCNFRLTPYYTGHNNFSLHAKRLGLSTEKVLINIDKKLNRVIIRYPNMNLFLPEHSTVEIKSDTDIYNLTVSQVLWENSDTIIYTRQTQDSNIKKKLKNIQGVKLNHLSLRI